MYLFILLRVNIHVFNEGLQDMQNDLIMDMTKRSYAHAIKHIIKAISLFTNL